MRASSAVVVVAWTLWSSSSFAAGPVARGEDVTRGEEGDADARRKAEEAMRTGVKEYSSGNFERARAAFIRAWELKQHPAIAASLGDTEMRLGLYREAATHWTFYLANAPPGRDRSEADQALVECRRHVASIRVAVDQVGAEISLDGQAAGKSPIDVDLWLEPGTHSVSAQSADGRSATQQIELKAGDSRAIVLSLQPTTARTEPTAASASSSPSSAAVTPPRASTRTPAANAPSLRVPVVIAGSLLTATAIAIGVVYAGKESGAESDVERYEGQIDDTTTDPHLVATHGGCSDLAKSRPAACSALSDSADTVVSSRRMKTIAFVGAGVFGVATVVTYLLWPTAEPTGADKPQVSLIPWNDSGQGVKFSLRF